MDKSEINLPRIDPNSNSQQFNGLNINMGVASILNKFHDLSKSVNRPKWNLYLINIETLIRDCHDKELTTSQIGQRTLDDCMVMAQYINEYCQLVLPANEKRLPIVCFYLPKYVNKTSMKLLRDKFPKGTEERWQSLALVKKLLLSGNFNSTYEDTEILFCALDNDKQWPHQELFTELFGRENGISFRDTLMISHVPSDFHLYRKFDKFSILESYTGAVKTKKDFGKKVFGDEAVPFNKYTHLLFGDKWYVKCMLDIKQKRMAKELAKKEHWSLLPDNIVLEKLVSAKLVDAKTITKIEF